MKKIIKLSLSLLLVAGLLNSCDSPLSDVNIDDPSLINTIFLLEKNITDTDQSEIATAVLTDKNLALVELKEGEVLVNDIRMNWVNFTRIYSSEISIEKNTQYIFTVKLADDVEYNSVIRTPENLFGTVSAPESSNFTSDITITWTDFNAENDIKIVFESWNSMLGQKTTIFETTTTDDGRYTIDNGSMNYPHKYSASYENTFIRLVRETSGELNNSLRGGTITSRITYSKEIDLIN